MPEFAPSIDLATLNGTNGFRLDGIDNRDFSGLSVSSAGDVNGDGFDDILISAPFGDPGGYNENQGESYVVFGKPAGFAAAFDLASLDGSNGFRLDGIDVFDFSGFSVSSAGDVNGDGFDDVLIGCKGADFSAGESYVVFGKASGFAASLNFASLNGSNGFRLDGIGIADGSGAFVASAGDINGDGFDDILIGAPYAGPGQNYTREGETYVVFGKASGFAAALDLATLDGINGFRLDGIDAGEQSGQSVSSAGDINGDGFGDIVIGAPDANQGTNFVAGESYVVFGRASGFAASFDLATLDGTNGFRLNGIDLLDRSGFSVSLAGDINGDGLDDILIGAGGDPGGNTDAGESYVVFGKVAGFAAALDLSTLDGTNGFRIDGIDAYDGSAWVSSAGDVNGDGFDDILIGGATADPGGDSDAGESYVVFGTASGFAASLSLSILDGSNGFRLDGIDAEDRSGRSVSAAGDVNGDGFDDILIGAYQGDIAGQDTGESYLVFGHEAHVAVNRVGTAIANRINGGVGDDTISGLAGDDTLLGRGGNDIVKGGLGNDTLDGAAGIDTIDWSDATGALVVTLNAAGGGAVTAAGIDTDTFSNFENMIGGSAGDTLNGNASGNLISGGGGNDTLNGAGGNDTADYSRATGTGVIVNLGILVAQLISATEGSDRLIGIENLIGSAQGDRLFGDGGANTLAGGAGGDTLFGRDGDDFLSGGLGDDTLSGGAGNDRIDGGDGDEIWLVGNAGADHITGGLGNDRINGGDDDDIWLGGDADADLIRGGAGNDRIDGGDGDDTWLGGEAGSDTITGGLGNDRIDGGADADYAYGGAGNDVITGGNEIGAGDSWLGGEAGSDTIYGNDGNDRIDGGADADVLFGDAGNDTVTGGLGDDRIYGGNETGAGDAWLGGDAGSDTIHGNDGNDRIDGGADADFLFGDAGTDIITGGTGNDYIDGGTGNDSLFGNAGLDVFDFNAASGADAVQDFANDQDTLRIDPVFGLASAAAVVAATIAAGNDAIVNLGGGNTIRLVGYLAANTINSLLDDIAVA